MKYNKKDFINTYIIKVKIDGNEEELKNFGESELGQYIDRLIAQKIVANAKTYHAGSIVLPKLGYMGEIIQSEVQAKAEKKIPGYLEGQQRYAKEYRKQVHNWSYGRLIE